MFQTRTNQNVSGLTWLTEDAFALTHAEEYRVVRLDARKGKLATVRTIRRASEGPYNSARSKPLAAPGGKLDQLIVSPYDHEPTFIPEGGERERLPRPQQVRGMRLAWAVPMGESIIGLAYSQLGQERALVDLQDVMPTYHILGGAVCDRPHVGRNGLVVPAGSSWLRYGPGGATQGAALPMQGGTNYKVFPLAGGRDLVVPGHAMGGRCGVYHNGEKLRDIAPATAYGDVVDGPDGRVYVPVVGGILCLSPDGMADLALYQLWSGHRFTRASLAVSPDGSKLAIARGMTIIVLDLE